MRAIRRRLCCSLVIALGVSMSGCAAISIRDYPTPLPGSYKQLSEAEKSMLPNSMDLATPPRELDKVAQNEYRIAPPDSLLLSAARVVPKPPYTIQPLDFLFLNATGTFQAEVVQGQYQVGPDGNVYLGPSYGSVRISGLTPAQAQTAIERKLGETLSRANVTVTILQPASALQIEGEHFVSQDGFIGLGNFGRVYVTGLTPAEARKAIEEKLSKHLQDPQIGVQVISFNSQRYFVVLQGTAIGDRVLPIPSTGNETVLDAIAQVGELPRISSKHIWIARPSPDGTCDQIMPVDWQNVVKNASHETNYQVFPNDRVFVAEDRFGRLDSVVAKITAPMERMFGFSLLGIQTVQSVNRFPAGRNFGTGFF